MSKIVIDPVTRIQGRLRIEAVVEQGVVKEARCSGTLFRGLEVILQGRDPRDAQRITQRICGVCPTAHSVASALALDDAFGLAGSIPANGRLLRNLIYGSNFIQSHLLHFYQLAALDYVDIHAAAGYRGEDPYLRQVAEFVERGELAPFMPRYEGDYRLAKKDSATLVSHYVRALNARREAQEMLAVFGGKMPHDASIFPGGTLEVVSVDKIVAFRWRLERLRRFIEEVYLPDVRTIARTYREYFALGRGPGRYLSFGLMDLDSQKDPSRRRRAFPAGVLNGKGRTMAALDAERIAEEVKYSWYKSRSHLHPSQGETEADPTRPDGYSFVKAPRYGGQVHEVGPLARILIAHAAGHPRARPLVDSTVSELGIGLDDLRSTMGRHVARSIEAKLLVDAMAQWIQELRPGEPTRVRSDLPSTAEGVGMTEAPRGALGHWLRIKEGAIANYQVVVPTTWNCSPRDDHGQPGACEQALEGTRVRDPQNPFELVRIVRSFDPCLACAVHVLRPRTGWKRNTTEPGCRSSSAPDASPRKTELVEQAPQGAEIGRPGAE